MSTLVVVDVQRIAAPGAPWGITALPGIIEPVRALLAVAGPASVLTRHRLAADGAGTWRSFATRWGPLEADADLWELHEDLRAAVPDGAAVVDKTTYSAFDLDAVGQRLAASERRELVLAGCETDCCIAATMFAAIDAGVAVTLVADALVGPDPAGHVAILAVARRMPEQVRIVTTAQLLRGRWA